MKKIAAYLQPNRKQTITGFVFNTDIQQHVENFMDIIHRRNYVLCFDDEKPDGMYSYVHVEQLLNPEGMVIDATFTLKGYWCLQQIAADGTKNA
jgi:hypothetical protein